LNVRELPAAPPSIEHPPRYSTRIPCTYLGIDRDGAFLPSEAMESLRDEVLTSSRTPHDLAVSFTIGLRDGRRCPPS
jgi:hypothetical protein